MNDTFQAKLPTVKQVECERGDLPHRYQELLLKNGLLARIEAQARAVGWTDEEVRTMQLLVAVASNASLQGRLAELEALLAEKVADSRPRS